MASATGPSVSEASSAAALKRIRTFSLILDMRLTIRKAARVDVPGLQALIRASVLELQAGDYSPQQTYLALQKVFGVDTQLIEDGTCYVAEAAADAASARVLAGCGGWSRRKTLFGSDHCAGREDALLNPDSDAAKIRAFFVHPAWARRGIGSKLLEVCESAAAAAGFQKFEMAATLTGIPLYAARGYVEGETKQVPLAPGIFLPIVHMEKRL